MIILWLLHNSWPNDCWDESQHYSEVNIVGGGVGCRAANLSNVMLTHTFHISIVQLFNSFSDIKLKLEQLLEKSSIFFQNSLSAYFLEFR